ncbi:MAG TPA: DUF4266 domain-containing protein [Burkholderiaceae bacterium]|nr:DUF4266 domain-containing protein [Burkholderiaceae bacterium]
MSARAPIPPRALMPALAGAVLTLLMGCSPIEPWVKPYERERLADPVMKPSPRESLAAKHNEHIREVREGARGANGVQGGGCGCN